MTNESALEAANRNESAAEGFPPLRVHRHTKFWLILAGTAASLASHHEIGLHHPLAHCVSESLLYAVCIGLPLLTVAERCCLYVARQPWPWKWIYLLGSILIPATLGTFVAGTILYAMGFHGQEKTGPVTWDELRQALGLSLIFGISVHLYESLREQLAVTSLQLRTRQRDAERARKLALVAQLASLESRVRPHFLFNTLNSISALVREQPEQAEQMIERLSSLLRFSLDANHHRTVPLRDEVKLARAYLEIEKARFGARLQFSFDIPVEFNAVAVPPFALQTLVENSVKYAVSQRRAGGKIHVTACAQDDSLLLQVCDDGPGFTTAAITAGHGLDNLQARLAALFAGRATLDIASQTEAATVTLTLPILHEAVNFGASEFGQD
jgi:signal transduction histidine kinase